MIYQMARAMILLPLLLLASNAEAQTVGLLSMVSGDVKIVRSGQSAAARTADLITAGDRVITGSGAEATFLFCPESRAAKLTAGGEVEFTATALTVRKGNLDQERKVPTCRLPTTLALSAASKLQAGNLKLRGEGLVLRSPAYSSVPSLQPRFRWDAVQDATGYELTVLDREENILWRQNLAQTEAPYPATGRELRWGQRYRWQVRALQGSETLDAASSNFQLLADEQASQVRISEASLLQLRQASPSDNGPLFLLAFLYEENGMFDQAARIYGELAQRMGEQEWVQVRLRDLMVRLRWDSLDVDPAR
jgi:hypothetical protein